MWTEARVPGERIPEREAVVGNQSEAVAEVVATNRSEVAVVVAVADWVSVVGAAVVNRESGVYHRGGRGEAVPHGIWIEGTVTEGRLKPSMNLALDSVANLPQAIVNTGKDADSLTEVRHPRKSKPLFYFLGKINLVEQSHEGQVNVVSSLLAAVNMVKSVDSLMEVR